MLSFLPVVNAILSSLKKKQESPDKWEYLIVLLKLFFFQTPTQVILAYFFSKSLGQTQTPKEIQEALYFTAKNKK